MNGLTTAIPTVSIGLPVRNGEDFIAQAIEAALAQTFTDFELVIRDNASNDATEEICKHYVDLDERIRYARVQHNEGAARNFNEAFAMSRGRYFKWMAHDDLIERTFLKSAFIRWIATPPPHSFSPSSGRSMLQDLS